MAIASVAGGVAAYATVIALEPAVQGVAGALLQVIVGGIVCFAVALSLGAGLRVPEVVHLSSRAADAIRRRRTGRKGQ